MTGSEVRKILQENRINFAWLAKELGISPQGLNSRLLAKEFRQSYLLELNRIIGQDIFDIGENVTDGRQPVYDIQVSAGYGTDLTSAYRWRSWNTASVSQLKVTARYSTT